MPSQTRNIDDLILDLIRLKYPGYPAGSPIDKQFAPMFGVDAPAFSNYKNGKRKPRENQTGKMADAWAKELEEVPSEELRRRIKARELPIEGITLAGDIRKLLDAATVRGGLTTWRVSSLDYGVFAGNETGFFDLFIGRYLSQLGVSFQTTTRRGFNIGEALKSGEIQLAVCYFASASRAAAARFFLTPLRVSLGAVCMKDFGARLDELGNALWTPLSSTVVPKIKPIVVRGEVGHLYCQQTLELGEDDPRMTVHPVLERGDLKTLLEAESKIALANPDAPVPVLIVDEYSSFGVLQLLRGRGRRLVPISNARSTQVSTSRRELPQYFMALACPREDARLGGLIEESLSLFFTTEVETTARALADTYWKLEEEVRNAIAETGSWDDEEQKKYTPAPLKERPHLLYLAAREYALYTLSLDMASRTNPVHPPYWNRILERARQIVDDDTIADASREHVKQEPDKTRRAEAFVQSLVPPRLKDETRQFEYLKRFIDTEIKINECRGANAEELLRLMAARLSRSDEQMEKLKIEVLDPRVVKWDSLQDASANGIKQLLNQIAAMYRNLPNPIGEDRDSQDGTIGEQIALQIDGEVKDRFRDYERILLATISRRSASGKETVQAAGILCVRLSKHHPGAGEFRYLWVANRFRSRNISHPMLGAALEWCEAQKDPHGKNLYDRVRLAILPTLEDAIARVSRIDFNPVDPSPQDKKDAKGRLIFERVLR